MSLTRREGYFRSRGYRVWYSIVESSSVIRGKHPLLILHGGPGLPHNYLRPLEKLAESGRRVIFYDQLGCGKSDRPKDDTLYSPEYYTGEIDNLRKELSLENLHILGQSWGGMLGMEYAVKEHNGLKGLILSNSPCSTSHWMKEARRLKDELPESIKQVLNSSSISIDSKEYTEAVKEFYRRHVCRLNPWPDCLNESMKEIEANPAVYIKMWGTSEFDITGTLEDWDITERLHQINTPTLVIGGRYDEATPEITEEVKKCIPGAELVIFENCSHLCHLERPSEYIRTVEDFLDRTEKYN